MKESKIKFFLLRLLNRELLLYILFGGFTTLFSIIIYYICDSVIGIHYAVANIISWIFAVTFAYLTNKFFVFRAVGARKGMLLLELLLFYCARLFSLCIEEGGLYLFIEIFGIESLISKIILQVIVVALNYAFSKLVIFKRKRPDSPE